MRLKKDASSIRSTLEAEFCPPLDSSLVAAMCSDLDSSLESLETLRDALSRLAAEAIAENPSISISTSHSYSNSSSNSGLPEANGSSSGVGIVDSPLAFLRAAFPDLSIQVLQDAIDNAQSDEAVDMQSIVEELLSSELLSSSDARSLDDEDSWEAVASPKAEKKKGKQTSKPKPKKIVIGDVRHRQLMASASQQPKVSDQIDPWSQLSSLSEYLSTLVPIPAATILSSFHSPEYPNAFQALASQINSLPPSQRSAEEVDTDLINMTEMMSGGDDTEELDSQWARKCIQVTEGRLGDAMDLYGVLKEIRQLAPIAHLKPPGISHGDKPLSIPSSPQLPITPRSPQVDLRSPITKTPRMKPVQASEWQVVEKRQPKPSQLHPHAEFIPAYRNFKAVPAWTIQSQPTDEVAENQAIEQNWRDKRVEALRKASQHWQRGQDGYGRMIAGFYAEEANRYLLESREAAVEVARAVVIRNRVENKASGHHNRNAIDLHGLTRDQALVIVREALASRAIRRDASKDEPLRFITGKGNHSAGNKSVLSPALQKALRADGWSVREVEAGLVVYGKV